MTYHHLSFAERHVICHLRLFGLSDHEIGRRLGGHHTTIGREVHLMQSNRKASQGQFV